MPQLGTGPEYYLTTEKNMLQLQRPLYGGEGFKATVMAYETQPDSDIIPVGHLPLCPGLALALCCLRANEMMVREVLLEVWVAGLSSISPLGKVLPAVGAGWAGEEGEGGPLSCVASQRCALLQGGRSPSLRMPPLAISLMQSGEADPPRRPDLCSSLKQ